MTRFLIVQHAEKERESVDGDPGLTDLGRSQAAAVATRLAASLAASGGVPAGVYTSPLRRARETAAALPWPAAVDERLRERMNWTPACGLTFEEFLAEWVRATADRDYQPAVGESSRAAGARLAAALSDLAGRHGPDATVVLVAHGGVTLDLLRDLRGDDGLPLADGIEPCTVTTVEWP